MINQGNNMKKKCCMTGDYIWIWKMDDDTGKSKKQKPHIIRVSDHCNK
jgi:hypothetical protein